MRLLHVLIKVSVAIIKHYDQRYLGEKGVIQLTDSRPIWEVRAGTRQELTKVSRFLLDAIVLFSYLAFRPLSLDTLDYLPMGGTTHNGSSKSTAYSLLFVTCSNCFLRSPWTISTEVVRTTVGLTPYQSVIKKMLHRLAQQPVWEKHTIT